MFELRIFVDSPSVQHVPWHATVRMDVNDNVNTVCTLSFTSITTQFMKYEHYEHHMNNILYIKH